MSDQKALAIIRDNPAFESVQKAIAPFLDPTKFNLLMPTTFVGVSPVFVPMPVVVEVNPDDERDVYATPGSGGSTVCLHSRALERIGNAGGLDFDPSLVMHAHDFAKEPLVCSHVVGGWYLDPIGQRRLVTGEATHDLRDGSKRVKLLGGVGSKPVDVARQFICEQCRSRARADAIRKCMNLASSYKKDELRRPFVALRFRLNEADEQVKQALIARAVGATTEVFGERRALPAPPAVDRGEDVIEAQAAEVEEPDIPDEKAPEQKVDIRAAIARLAKTGRDTGEKADAEALGTIAYALRDTLGLKKDTSKNDLAVLRRRFVGTIFGVNVADMTVAQRQALIDATKDAQGQRDLVDLFAHLADLDDDVKRIREAAR